MPLLILLVVLLLAVVVPIALTPIAVVQRYRTGTARRVARGWSAGLNVAALAISVVLFLSGAVVTNLWVPKAFTYTIGGLAAGCLLGVVGLRLTRWESEGSRLFFTPNRLLVLAITLLVAGRIAYGFWRMWQLWQSGSDERSWLVGSGIPGSLGAGALVLGYSLAFWIGVGRKARQQRD